MHFILVGLDGDAGQSRIAADIVRLPQKAVARAESAAEQADQVDLAAGFREHIKILIVDMDIPVHMSHCDIFWQNIIVGKILASFRTVF